MNLCMCNNDNCEKASDCLRFMGIPSDNQPYAEFKNICKQPDYALFVKIDSEELRKEKKDE